MSQWCSRPLPGVLWRAHVAPLACAHCQVGLASVSPWALMASSCSCPHPSTWAAKTAPRPLPLGTGTACSRRLSPQPLWQCLGLKYCEASMQPCVEVAGWSHVFIQLWMNLDKLDEPLGLLAVACVPCLLPYLLCPERLGLCAGGRRCCVCTQQTETCVWSAPYAGRLWRVLLARGMGGCSHLLSRWRWWSGAHSCRGAC